MWAQLGPPVRRDLLVQRDQRVLLVRMERQEQQALLAALAQPDQLVQRGLLVQQALLVQALQVLRVRQAQLVIQDRLGQRVQQDRSLR